MDPVGRVPASPPLGRPQPRGAAAVSFQTAQVRGNELRLVIDQSELAAVRLNHSGHEQVIALGMKHSEEEIGPPVLPRQLFDGHKRKRDVEAGRTDDRVDPLAAAVAEADFAAVEFLDIRLHSDRAAPDVDRPTAVDRRMRFKERVVHSRRKMRLPTGAANAGNRQPPQPQGQPPTEHPFASFVDRPAAKESRQNRIPTTQAMKRRIGMTGTLAGDVIPRIATPHHQDSSASQRLRRLVLRRVQHVAVEAAWTSGPTRVPIVPIGDHQSAVVPTLAARERHVPADGRIVGRRDGYHGHVELNTRIEIESLGIAAQIAPHHVSIRMIRIMLGHGEIGVLGERLRGDEPSRAIDAACRTAEVPIAADVILAFEAIEREARGAKILGYRQAGRTGAENAELLRCGSAAGRCVDHERTWRRLHGTDNSVLCRGGRTSDGRGATVQAAELVFLSPSFTAPNGPRLRRQTKICQKTAFFFTSADRHRPKSANPCDAPRLEIVPVALTVERDIQKIERNLSQPVLASSDECA